LGHHYTIMPFGPVTLIFYWPKTKFFGPALISGTGNCLGCLNGCYMPLVAFYNSYTPTHATSSCQPLNKPLYWTYFVIYEILINYLLYGRISRFLFLYFSVLCLTDSVTHVRNSEIKQLRPLFFAILLDIDLIFVLWVYNDKLQIKFTFRSGPMIFGRVMALGLWNLAKYLVVTTFFAMLGNIYLMFGIWVYNDELQNKFTFRFGPMIFGRVIALGLWNLAKYLVVTTFFTMLGDID
jgi:hypothetical protein